MAAEASGAFQKRSSTKQSEPQAEAARASRSRSAAAPASSPAFSPVSPAGATAAAAAAAAAEGAAGLAREPLEQARSDAGALPGQLPARRRRRRRERRSAAARRCGARLRLSSARPAAPGEPAAATASAPARTLPSRAPRIACERRPRKPSWVAERQAAAAGGPRGDEPEVEVGDGRAGELAVAEERGGLERRGSSRRRLDLGGRRPLPLRVVLSLSRRRERRRRVHRERRRERRRRREQRTRRARRSPPSPSLFLLSCPPSSFLLGGGGRRRRRSAPPSTPAAAAALSADARPRHGEGAVDRRLRSLSSSGLAEAGSCREKGGCRRRRRRRRCRSSSPLRRLYSRSRCLLRCSLPRGPWPAEGPARG